LVGEPAARVAVEPEWDVALQGRAERRDRVARDVRVDLRHLQGEGAVDLAPEATRFVLVHPLEETGEPDHLVHVDHSLLAAGGCRGSAGSRTPRLWSA